MTMSGDGSSALSGEQLQQVISAVQEGMRAEMTSLKRELLTERGEADERLLKKMRLEKQPTFRRKSNEKQYQPGSQGQDGGGCYCTGQAGVYIGSEVQSS